MQKSVDKRLINVDEYHKMAEVGILKANDRVELIHGEIYERSPIGSKHAAIVDRMARLLNQLFWSQAVIRVQNPIRLNDNNEPEPDVGIFKYRKDDYVKSHPGPKDALILIEVSESIVRFDRKIKTKLYASFGIPEYWIINIDKDEIEIFQNVNPAISKYDQIKLYKKGEHIDLLGQSIAIRDFFPG